MINLAIFASGKGSNTENICRYFKDSRLLNVSLIVSDKENPGVKMVADTFGIPFYYINTILPDYSTLLLQEMQVRKIDMLALAGYLKMIPRELIAHYPEAIINIHPSLLPMFGGKGMYGLKVHEAVAKAGLDTTGITVHYVDDEYDQGKIIFQTSVTLHSDDSPLRIADKVHELEMLFYPRIIEQVALQIKNHSSG